MSVGCVWCGLTHRLHYYLLISVLYCFIVVCLLSFTKCSLIYDARHKNIANKLMLLNDSNPTGGWTLHSQ